MWCWCDGDRGCGCGSCGDDGGGGPARCDCPGGCVHARCDSVLFLLLRGRPALLLCSRPRLTERLPLSRRQPRQGTRLPWPWERSLPKERLLLSLSTPLVAMVTTMAAGAASSVPETTASGSMGTVAAEGSAAAAGCVAVFRWRSSPAFSPFPLLLFPFLSLFCRFVLSFSFHSVPVTFPLFSRSSLLLYSVVLPTSTLVVMRRSGRGAVRLVRKEDRAQSRPKMLRVHTLY